MNNDAKNNPKLERYLSTLESSLKPFPVSDRAEIITEIKSHILDALERDPNANLNSILAALGEPEIVANRYLLERGLKPTKPPISPIVKWVIIGFLGTLAIVMAFIIALITKFSPVVSVNEKNESVSLFGGAIQVDGKKNGFRIEGQSILNADDLKGSAGVAVEQTIDVKFANGNFEVRPAEGSNFVYECRGIAGKDLKSETVGTVLTFDVTASPGANCELQVPKIALLKIEGRSGNLELAAPSFNVEAVLESGNISFEADEKLSYKFDVKTENGRADSFTSSDSPEALSIKLNAKNGNIEN